MNGYNFSLDSTEEAGRDGVVHHVWQYKNGKWKLSRMLSYDSQDVK